MKRLYLFLSLLSVVCSLSPQNNNQNYVLTRTMLNASGTQYIDNIQYFDGLGHPSQNVQKGVTPSRANLVTLQEYDGFGRATKSWLPHVTTSTYLDPGSFKNSVPGTYNGDSRPYAETIYENSPLNRVVEQYGPGAAWSQHPVSTSYLTNTASGDVTFHEIGHVIYQGKSQNKVIDYHNKSRNRLLLTPRPYDEHHNKNVKRGVY